VLSVKPFRWDLSKPEQLGKLVEGPAASTYDGFPGDLRTCCARVLAFSDNARLVFVGRSPESLFDYLSGLLALTSRPDRCCLLNISNRGESISSIRDEDPDAHYGIREHLRELQLDPPSITSAARPFAFVDLVAEGGTFVHLSELLIGWARAERVDVKSLCGLVRFIGITLASKTSPNTWRWQQDAPWLNDYPRSAVCNVSIRWALWDYLCNTQDKASVTNPPERWSDLDMELPPRFDDNLAGLRLALQLYNDGQSKAHRRRFATELSKTTGMRHAWFRTLALKIKK
jgi:hypothetical protein